MRFAVIILVGGLA